MKIFSGEKKYFAFMVCFLVFVFICSGCSSLQKAFSKRFNAKDNPLEKVKEADKWFEDKYW